MSLFARSLENPLDPTPAWPMMKGTRNDDLRRFNTSTEFFEWVIEAGVMNVDFSFFAAPGMTAEKSQNANAFDHDNNAWSVAIGVDDSMKDGAPVLFTSNIRVKNGASQLSRLNQDVHLSSAKKPFGDKGGVVVLNGGSAFTVKKDTISSNIRFLKQGGWLHASRPFYFRSAPPNPLALRYCVWYDFPYVPFHH